MPVGVGVTARQRATNQRRDEQQRGKVAPLEDVERVARRLERAEGRRRLRELPDALDDGQRGEDAEDGRGDGEDWLRG